MNRTSKIVGITTCIFVILFIVGFLIIFLLNPIGEYTGINSLIDNYNDNEIMPVIPSFLLVIFTIPLFAVLYFMASKQTRVFAFIGVLFGICYTICCGINYFIQLSIVPHLIKKNVELAEIFYMGNPYSAMAAIDNLGYLFLAIAFLFFSILFSLRRFESWIKSIFIIYGITGIMGAVGYITKIRFFENFVFLSAIPYLIGIIFLLIYLVKVKDSSK